MTQALTHNNFVQLVAYFLAEVIRSRRTSLRRAAEISQRVIDHIQELVSEDQALAWVTNIEKEFEEISSLKMALHFNYQASEVEVYEKEIKEFASGLFEQDLALSASFLKDASSVDNSIQQLCIKYPGFCEYLMKKTDKAELLPEFGQAG